MATITRADKAGSLLPAVTTTEHSYAITPTTTSTSTSNEKKNVTSTEFQRNSSVSAPGSVHQSNAFDTDIEAGISSQSCDNLNLKTTCTGRTAPNPNCTVWPGQEHWRQKAKAQKRNNRACNCMAGYTRRTRIILKILIIFLIIGIAVGVGFGVSKPLGAGIWKPKDS
ncbi:hypothetical protein MN608_06173 [Microdochium nivale]|nr:hypothetical protein MN608_06173 [Microdochium nivale]